ncbi:hypothetical protein [Aeromonas sp. s6]|uniref:hypothetical protein n=1 Tax=Aeromonas sp. s6 TaxID=3138488 RepID=UPI0034A22741
MYKSQVLVNEYGEQHFPCFIKPGSTIGRYFVNANERYLNPFEDGEFLVSLRIILAMSYDSMLNSISDDGYSYRFISLTRDCSNRMKKLTVEENSLLAEKELSQLERRLATYKNLVELAVHLD